MTEEEKIHSKLWFFYMEKCFLLVFWNSWKYDRSIMELFYQDNKITVKNLNILKKSLHAFFSGCLEKLLFSKFQLSTLSPITLLKTDLSNVCVSVLRYVWVFLDFLELPWKHSCGKTTSKVACEASAFYICRKNSTTLSLIFVSKSSFFRDFKKFPFSWSCKLIGYRNTTRNELLAKFLKLL